MDPDPTGADLFISPVFDGVFNAVTALIGLSLVAFVAMAVLAVVLSVRRARRLREAGLDPLDPTTDLTIRLAQSRMLAPGTAAPPPDAGPRFAGTLEQRLAELDALHRAGTITTAERDAARAKLLGTL